VPHGYASFSRRRFYRHYYAQTINIFTKTYFMGLFSSSSKKSSTGRFVPDGSGFKELTDELKDDSINGISQHLGYHPDQVHTYWGDFDQTSDINHIAVEVFTMNIIFVLTKNTVTKLDKKKVQYFLRNFRISEVFDSIATRDIFERAIPDKSLKIDFLSRVLNIADPDPNGMFFVKSLNLNLFFIDGYLVDTQSSDGLSEWAKDFKKINPTLMANYEKVARLYWGTNLSQVIKEINIQADSLAGTPNSVSNEFLPLHETPFGTINFAMLLVCHYGKRINLNEFKEINHGRYKEVRPNTYKVDKFVYEFFEDGTLSNSYLSN
jgi:hypothetical protein